MLPHFSISDLEVIHSFLFMCSYIHGHVWGDYCWTLLGLSTSSFFKEWTTVFHGGLTDAACHGKWFFCGFVVSHYFWSIMTQISFCRIVNPYLCVCGWLIMFPASFFCFSKSFLMKRLPAMHSYYQDHNQTSQPLEFCQCVTQAIAMCDKWQKCGTLVPHCVACCNWQIIIVFSHKNCLQSAFSESMSHIKQFGSLTCLHVICKMGSLAVLSDCCGYLSDS